MQTAKLPYYLCLCLSLLSGLSYAEEKSSALAPIKIAFPVSPYAHVDTQGNPNGFLPSLVSAIGERMGREVDIQIMPYLRSLYALKTGQVDVAYGLHILGDSIHLPKDTAAPTEPQLILPASLYALSDKDISVDSWKATANYRIGTVHLETKDRRVKRDGQGEVYYYKDAYSLIKALQANQADLATLDPVSAQGVTQKLGVPLKRIHDYSSLHIYPVFSTHSPRIDDPLAFCQAYVETRARIFDEGIFEAILNDIQMMYLLPYYNRAEILPGHCRIN